MIELCCLLWARPGCEAGLHAYEDRVLTLVESHGGRVISRAIGDGSDDRPHEVQLFGFESQAALDAYLADPLRVELSDERERVVARTDLFPVTIT